MEGTRWISPPWRSWLWDQHQEPKECFWTSEIPFHHTYAISLCLCFYVYEWIRVWKSASFSGKWGLQMIRAYELLEILWYTLLWNKHFSYYALPPVSSSTRHHSDGVTCVVVEVGQGGTGCCCIVHCVHHQRASLRLVVNSNKVNTHWHTLRWPLPWHSNTRVVCSCFSSHSNWDRWICVIAYPPSDCCD